MIQIKNTELSNHIGEDITLMDSDNREQHFKLLRINEKGIVLQLKREDKWDGVEMFIEGIADNIKIFINEK